jgi:preprotein translocase subunit SecA
MPISLTRMLGGDPTKKEIDKLIPQVEEINELEAVFEVLSTDELRQKTTVFKQRLADGENLDDILPEAYAAVREASKRTNGMRHFDVQMIGGMILHHGKIAEMRTGEGKTLVATLPLYLNALTGRGVHLVTVNDYLARRDARWMGKIYHALGMTVGILQMAARTDNGINAFLYDPEKTSPHEDQDQMRLVPRHDAYQADITYGTNSEFGFDYLRDNLTMSLKDRVQRGHYYAIVDEVDNILIDEARTPLIISGPASDDTGYYLKMAQVIKQLQPEDYEISEKDQTVSLTEIGEAHVEQLLNTTLRDPERPEDITPEQARLYGYLEQALKAQFLYRRNKEYLVQAGKVVIVDEFTGRLMPGRRWSDGLHQAVEAKEGVKVEAENVTYATITLQNYFRMYEKLAGMTGTALTEAEEFYKIYKLDVLPIPTNLEYRVIGADASLQEVATRDDSNYKYSYYALRNDNEKKPIFWRRKDHPDLVYRTDEAKLRAIAEEITRFHILGRPQLVGTTSVEHSERLSDRLRAEPIRRLLQTLLIRDAWFEKNHREPDGRSIPDLQPLNQKLDTLAAPELRHTARDLGLTSINPEDPSNLPRLLKLLELSEHDIPRLQAVIQGGIPHQVLNAKKHDEESQIIAKAGAFGAVTIATNMAGRGVDIKLGGDLLEEILSNVNRILGHAGVQDPYNLTMPERYKALTQVDPLEYGIYEEDARTFIKYIEDMDRVRDLGGLHVIGSERHEARRIDNQLRGRAARQGDPGSSRFYLSLDDDLMRLFGGQQVENLMQRLNIDEAVPIESGIIGRMVEQSQTRVEGSNFDVRKHLLEYDDVLNAQRLRIYGQRDQIFTKENLEEDILDMLQKEIQRRVPAALEESDGGWKLLAYLEEIQPPIDYPDVFYPSYTLRLLLEELGQPSDAGDLKNRLIDLARRAIQAENAHIKQSTQNMLERASETMDSQLAERNDALDTFLENYSEFTEDENNPQQRRPQEVLDELMNLTRTPFRLPVELFRVLASDPRAAEAELRNQVSGYLVAISLTRLVNSLERRLGEPLGLKADGFQNLSWDEASGRILDVVDNILTKREEHLIGVDGQILLDLNNNAPRIEAGVTNPTECVRLLGMVAQASRVGFDPKTHQRVVQMTTRIRFPYLAAETIQGRKEEDVTRDVLLHCEDAQAAMVQVWGRSEYARLTSTNVTPAMLEERLQQALTEQLGQEKYTAISLIPLVEQESDIREQLVPLLGNRVHNEVYRQILLGAISELWVDYLTQVESLRVSIGLEAYAQKDPLISYKSKASEMFQNLLENIRSSVVSRMFVYRPRMAAVATQPAVNAPESARSIQVPSPKPPQGSGKHKKKRRRH